MSSPFQNKMKRQQRRNERLMRRAARVSSRESGESMGGIDYESPKVQKILGKTNKVKTISYNDVDPRLEEQGRRYGSSINYGSPLNSYVLGGGGMKYVSILPHIQKLQKSFTNMAINSEEKKREEEKNKKSMFKSDGTLKNEFSSKYTPDEKKSTYNFQTNIGLSDFEKSNKENPYYKGQS